MELLSLFAGLTVVAGIAVVVLALAARGAGNRLIAGQPISGAPVDGAQHAAGAASALPSGPKPAEAAAVAGPKLRVAVRGGFEECPIDAEPFSIGRRADCCLELAHDSVSRRHAELRREDGQWYLVDSGSANGVFVNGRRVSATALQDGDRIEVGPFALIFVDAPGLREPETPPVYDTGRFEVLDEIGRGGMARVYRARLQGNGAVVAVKVPRLEMAAEPAELVQRFLREAQITERMQHPNIVRVLGHGTMPDSAPYMLMEFLEGGSLRARMRAGEPLDEPMVRRMGAQMAAGLAHAHRMGVVHRDIKPENMLFDRASADSRLKLTDFGIARGKGFPSLTRTGLVPGTVHYMSPEQAEGAFLTAASDVYALGCVLYEMAAGCCPFEGEAMAILRAHVGQVPKRPREANPTLSADLDCAIARFMSKAPDQRPTADEAVRMLA